MSEIEEIEMNTTRLPDHENDDTSFLRVECDIEVKNHIWSDPLTTLNIRRGTSGEVGTAALEDNRNCFPELDPPPPPSNYKRENLFPDQDDEAIAEAVMVL